MTTQPHEGPPENRIDITPYLGKKIVLLSPEQIGLLPNGTTVRLSPHFQLQLNGCVIIDDVTREWIMNSEVRGGLTAFGLLEDELPNGIQVAPHQTAVLDEKNIQKPNPFAVKVDIRRFAI